MDSLTGATPDPGALDLASPEAHRDRDAVRRYLAACRRTGEPLTHHSRNGVPYWVVTTHRQVREVCQDAATFTSSEGNVLDTLLAGGDSAAGRMMAVSDGAPHREVRRRLRHDFDVRGVHRLAEGICSNLDQRLDAAVSAGTVEFASAVAAHIPLAAICDLLGVPERDRGHLLAQTNLALTTGTDAEETFRTQLAQAEILAYFTDLLGRPGAKSSLVASLTRDDDRPLNVDDVVFNLYSILIAGDETARLAMLGAVHAFATFPEQWALLRRKPEALDTAVDEVLRWTTPAIHVGRIATRDVAIGSTTIAEGDIVTAWLNAANFDEQEFLEPDRFDVQRERNPHLTFSYGPHFCIGNRMARLEIRSFLEVALARIRAFEITGPPQVMASNFISGYTELPVRLVPLS